MSLTGIGFIGVFAIGLVLAFVRNPIYGLYAYLWVFYNDPSSRWWGRGIPDFRWSLMAAVVALISVAVHKPRQDGPGWFDNWGARLLTMFTVWMWIQSTWAVNPAFHFEGCILFTKYVVLFYLMYRLISTERDLENFCWAHITGCFLWGWIAYGTEVHGRLELVLGPAVDDSNLLGFHMVTGLATAGFMFISQKGKKRWLALVPIPFILNTVIQTASRSAVLGLLAAGAAGLFLGPKQYRRRLLVCSALAVVLLLRLAQNDIFWDRVATIQSSATADSTEEMENSAASRIVIAAAEMQMFRDYPLGAGFRGNVALSPRYIPAEYLTGGVRAAHNTFMAVLVDGGVPAIIIFGALILWACARLFMLKFADRKGLPATLGSYRAAAGASLAAYVMSGMFVNLLKSEVGIWLLVMIAILDVLVVRMVPVTATAQSPLPAAPSWQPAAPAMRAVAAHRLKPAELIVTRKN